MAFKLSNGNFGGAIVLEAVYDTPYGFNLVAVTDLNGKEKPTIDDIANAHVLSLNYASWDNKEQICWFIPNQYKKDSDRFEVIGKIQVKKKYDYSVDSFSSAGDWFIWVIEVASTQFEKGKSNWFKRSTKIKQYL